MAYNISSHITYSEAVHSDTAKRLGIDNTPNFVQLYAMQNLAKNIYEPVINHFGVKIYISSFFRSDKLNKAIKGAIGSQHVLGEAMDIDAELYGMVSNKDIFYYIKNNLEFDQLIWEYGTEEEPAWVHVSFTTRRPNRKQVFVTYK